MAGVALYAGEGGKTGQEVSFANSDPRMILFFVTWLRRFFPIEEPRLRLRSTSTRASIWTPRTAFWSALTGIPVAQFGQPYRAVPDPSIRRAKHVMGCPRVRYHCAEVHRGVMGLTDALLTCTDAFPG